MVGTLRLIMCRNVPKRCGFGCFVVLCFGLCIRFWTRRLRCWPCRSACLRPPMAAIWAIFYLLCSCYRAQHRSAIAVRPSSTGTWYSGVLRSVTLRGGTEGQPAGRAVTASEPWVLLLACDSTRKRTGRRRQARRAPRWSPPRSRAGTCSRPPY